MKNIDHIGIAVKDIVKSNALFEQLLGVAPFKEEIVESENVKTSFFQIGDSKIELVASMSEDSAIARYLEKNREGIHHLAFEVDDIYQEMKRLESEGFKPLSEKPKLGADNKLVCFFHPKTTNGVLIEICQSIKDNIMNELKVGDKAPDFEGVIQDGSAVSLSDYKGKKLVIYFYPKDNTPTCTTESCNLRDNYSGLKKQGFEILGVSPDSEKKHQNFIKKFELPFDLIADTERKMLESYNAWGPKKFMGREYDGVLRKTYVIDESGMITKIIDKVKAKTHTDQILE